LFSAFRHRSEAAPPTDIRPMDNQGMSEPSISVILRPGIGFTFDVIVRDLRGESRHRVTIEANEVQSWAKIGAEPSRCVEAVMRFLLDREPKESILSAFDMRVVRRYFPEFDDAFPRYLVRLGGEPGRRT
jgi:ribosomal protein S16